MAWYATGVAAVSVVSNIAGGMSANKKAKAAAKEQAELTFRQRQEEIRMKKAAAGFQKGAAVAGVHASNLQMSGSSARYVRALDTENMREIAYAKDAARMEKRAIQKGASGAGASLFANAGAQLGALAGGLASQFAAPGAGAPATLGGSNVSGHMAQSALQNPAAPTSLSALGG